MSRVLPLRKCCFQLSMSKLGCVLLFWETYTRKEVSGAVLDLIRCPETGHNFLVLRCGVSLPCRNPRGVSFPCFPVPIYSNSRTWSLWTLSTPCVKGSYRTEKPMTTSSSPHLLSQHTATECGNAKLVVTQSLGTHALPQHLAASGSLLLERGRRTREKGRSFSGPWVRSVPRGD